MNLKNQLLMIIFSTFLIPFAHAKKAKTTSAKEAVATTEAATSSKTAPQEAPSTEAPQEAPAPVLTVVDGVKILNQSTLKVGSETFDLKATSHGLRRKKVFGLATVKVYVVEFLSAHPEKLVKTSNQAFIDSLNQTKATQLRLTLLRDLSGKKISESFYDSLAVNSVDTKNPSKELKKVLDTIGSVKEFKENEVFTLSTVWKNGEAALVVEKPNGDKTKIEGPEQFAKDLHSIWFGKGADDRMNDLIKVLIK